MAELHQTDRAIAACVQVGRKIVQDLVRILILLVDQRRKVALRVKHDAASPFCDVQKSDRGAAAAAIIYIRLRACLVDDLQLGELRKPFLGELGADARLLGPAERNMRRHVEVLVDPHRCSFDLACDLMRPCRIRRPDRRAQP